MPIGELVRYYISDIFAYCEQNLDELGNLMSEEYSNRIFGVSYPFCMETTVVEQTDNNRRFWALEYFVCGKTVRVTNHWFEPSRSKFVQYLVDKNIINETEVADLLQSINEVNPQNVNGPARERANSRYRNPPIGNAQNGFVRSILGNLGYESFSESDWRKVKESFGQKCVYCGEEKTLVMDHAVPINRTHLGEHRLGNLVPACKECNSEKAGNDHREFLSSDSERLNKIEEHMQKYEYKPLKDQENFAQMQEVVKLAHEELKPLSKRYIKILNAMRI